MSVPSLTSWLAVVLVAVSVAMIGCGALRLRRIPIVVVVILTVTAVVASLLLAREYIPSRSVQITISSPRGGTEVSGTRIAVSGTVEPQGAAVVLLVRSERDLNWWAQNEVTTAPGPGNVGTWSVDAHLGTDQEGPGETFLLLAIASDNGWLFNLLTDRWITERSVRRKVPRWSRSEPTVIRRTR